MSNTTQQWKKRVNVFRYIFSVNMDTHLTLSEIKKDLFEKQHFDDTQTKIIEYYINNRNEIIDIISQKLAKQWKWERLPEVDRAILVSSYAEFKAINTDKKVIIDQAIITAKHFTNIDSFKYLNAILDRIIR